MVTMATSNQGYKIQSSLILVNLMKIGIGDGGKVITCDIIIFTNLIHVPVNHMALSINLKGHGHDVRVRILS